MWYKRQCHIQYKTFLPQCSTPGGSPIRMTEQHSCSLRKKKINDTLQTVKLFQVKCGNKHTWFDRCKENNINLDHKHSSVTIYTGSTAGRNFISILCISEKSIFCMWILWDFHFGPTITQLIISLSNNTRVPQAFCAIFQKLSLFSFH